MLRSQPRRQRGESTGERGASRSLLHALEPAQPSCARGRRTVRLAQQLQPRCPSRQRAYAEPTQPRLSPTTWPCSLPPFAVPCRPPAETACLPGREGRQRPLALPTQWPRRHDGGRTRLPPPSCVRRPTRQTPRSPATVESPRATHATTESRRNERSLPARPRVLSARRVPGARLGSSWPRRAAAAGHPPPGPSRVLHGCPVQEIARPAVPHGGRGDEPVPRETVRRTLPRAAPPSSGRAFAAPRPRTAV
mmetsp:Transcript_2788/g.8997  ORF Transcript_2788/g.8997 Transcript_2788/m.8997 type:complete len:250 (+) Transcript_2788:3475-4224(+)